MMEEGFVWIVTDGIVSLVQSLSYDGDYPSHYDGILGTIPAYGVGSDNYNLFKTGYVTDYGGDVTDLDVTSVLVSDGIKMVHAALENLDATDWDSTPAIQCDPASARVPWPGGETMLKELTQLTFTGTSGQIAFSEHGTPATTRYDITNFRGDGFVRVGSWSRVNTTNELEITGASPPP